MRIAQVAPLYESVPPATYGGTERVVSYLREELVRQGHDVTLFASGDSTTAARLRPVCPRALRLDSDCIDKVTPQVLQLEMVLQEADRFDMVHFHTGFLHFPAVRRLLRAQLTTIHGRMDLPELQTFLESFQDMPVVSISDAQRGPVPFANWQATVHNALPVDLYPWCEEPDGYFAFLGRISPEKRVDHAIEIARRVGVPLKIAAKVDEVDRLYFEDQIQPLLAQPGIEYLGEIGQADKAAFLGGARALLFPIDWPEPFGMVMIEAMACGTPTVALRRGSVPEVMEDGVTGYVVDDLEDAVEAARLVTWIDRKRCREVFERRFGAPRMAHEYVAVYEALLDRCERPEAVLAHP